MYACVSNIRIYKHVTFQPLQFPIVCHVLITILLLLLHYLNEIKKKTIKEQEKQQQQSEAKQAVATQNLLFIQFEQ